MTLLTTSLSHLILVEIKTKMLQVTTARVEFVVHICLLMFVENRL